MYSSTSFGRPHAHHQELNNCSSSLWFYRWGVVVGVLLVVVGRPYHDRQHCYHHAPTVIPEAATAVVELLMMGVSTTERCWAVHKRLVINLRNCCIWLVDLFEMFKVFIPFWHEYKRSVMRGIALLRTFRAIYEKPFELLHYFGKCQDGMNTSTCSGILVEHNDISVK